MREIPARRSDADCRIPDPENPALLLGSARVVIASTRAADGTYEDRTGPLLHAWLAGRGLDIGPVVVVPDGPEVGRAVGAAIADGVDVLITSGGTGISPSDVTPEQTAPHLDRELPGILEEVRRRGLANSPAALLSRGLAGMAGRTVVVNLPGSRGGVKDGIAVLDPILDHLLDQRDGGGHA
ncbi:MogA/MoaB family molybdenum cofactor biosynthesis protein [Brachybacterium phenoliresistens]|uniref:MogA/MoaB family molybdenum cofactor biosynthesis protein n=1 Tax=Brachybacterium phenoliresistens TaxID=396014 RepID=UPI0004ADD0F0|nr:molybdenum cofactor synthesis domain-containing protein [Brachybacterium phenoliresistens]